MKTRLLILIGCASLLCGCGTLLIPETSAPDTETFEEADTNGDGIVSEVEQAASKKRYDQRIEHWKATTDLKINPSVELMVQTVSTIGQAFLGPVSGTIGLGIMGALGVAVRHQNRKRQLAEQDLEESDRAGRLMTGTIEDILTEVGTTTPAIVDSLKTRMRSTQEAAGVRTKVQQLRGKA